MRSAISSAWAMATDRINISTGLIASENLCSRSLPSSRRV
jgi:hypothetical protein